MSQAIWKETGRKNSPLAQVIRSDKRSKSTFFKRHIEPYRPFIFKNRSDFEMIKLSISLFFIWTLTIDYNEIQCSKY